MEVASRFLSLQSGPFRPRCRPYQRSLSTLPLTGPAVFSLLLPVFIERFTWNVTLLLLASFQLHVCLFGALFHWQTSSPSAPPPAPGPGSSPGLGVGPSGADGVDQCRLRQKRPLDSIIGCDLPHGSSIGILPALPSSGSQLSLSGPLRFVQPSQGPVCLPVDVFGSTALLNSCLTLNEMLRPQAINNMLGSIGSFLIFAELERQIPAELRASRATLRRRGNGRLIAYLVGVTLFSFTSMPPIAYLFDRLRQQGFEDTTISVVSSLGGLFSALSRLSTGLLAGMLKVDMFHLSICYAAILAVSNVTSAFMYTGWQHSMYAAIYGWCTGQSSVTCSEGGGVERTRPEGDWDSCQSVVDMRKKWRK
ncbi:unnamed protein product [Protopolystoma xenopodis]|uniref:Uncharacterized protein n=1 Tax=Protopolystoma xenopodis TaxID=117903 RepID=A0A3S5ADK3_9PLAT|nr:unnamed protein product [Protopolystoma xenopodis]